jgi:ribulose-5-phosphate 4-epimerase/fuculose-1-phosphate aldolase
MLIRGRGKEESGLLFTKPSDVVAADFDGRMLRDKAGLKTPNESCIHGELYRARPEVGAVVHAHPPSLVLTSMAGIELTGWRFRPARHAFGSTANSSSKTA